MHTSDSIRLIKDIFNGQKINLPEAAGVYGFWWLGEKEVLLKSNRQIVLKGPGELDVEVEFQDWWPSELQFPCLYIGKSTNIKKRFALHLKRKSAGRLHEIPEGNRKQKAVTSSCQLRYGIEHVFKEASDPLDIIYNKVGFSYSTDFNDNAIAERFFIEDRLIGTWRPWFNIDSER